ncbi:hypothetical protein [Nocardia vinacea]|uniref:hypothetical protein n=1 Tax=Nocardia vinacea TaxID=96468 RepID=UPI000592DBE6|nr:hypothetical protein [Nocardia vinacea]
MSKTGRYNPRRATKGRNQPNKAEHRITMRSEKRTPPDLYKLSRAVIAMALAEAEAEKSAAAQPTQQNKPTARDEEASRDDR